MTAQHVEPSDPVRAHPGPWTEADYLALGEDEGQHIELVDGGLIVTPHGDNEHQIFGSRLWREFESQLPDDVMAVHEANVRLANGRILVPDVVVTRDLSRTLVNDVADVVLVAEIVSPSSRANDRILKPALYAEAGIRWYLRVERDPALELILCRRRSGSYEEHARARSGGELEVPGLDVSIEVDALTRRR